MNMRSFTVLTTAAAISLGLLGAAGPAVRAADPAAVKPTIVLVHGALAESSSWNGKCRPLNAFYLNRFST